MPIDVQRIQAVCFDVDGTLSDTDDLYTKRIAASIRRVAFIRRPDFVARRLVMGLESPGNALMSIADALGMDALVLPLINWIHRRVPRRRSEYMVVGGVAEMLPRLRARYPLAVISARDKQTTMEFLDACGLTPYFEVVLTALSARHTKPYPDPVLLAAKMMGIAPANCVMIGDTTVDVRAGKSAGAQTIAVLCGFGEEGELHRVGADLILPTTSDVGELLGASVLPPER
jgi:N-acetyl-D-muramate 6-phosphate phosphatase